MKITTLLIFYIVTFSLFSQDNEEIRTNDDLYNYYFKINNSKRDCHKRIPQTNIYICPEKNAIIEQKTIRTDRYFMSIVTIDSGESHNTVNDFNSQKFEKKGIKVFKNEYIKINNFEGKYIEMQADLDKKAIIVFIDGVSFKTNITIAYKADDKNFSNDVKEILSTLFIEQNQAIKEKSYNIITENTRFKENKSNSSIDLYTIDGKKQSQTEPNFTITEAYFENNIGLKNIGDYLIGGMQKYGLKNIKTSNEIDTKTEYSVEVLGELDDKSKLFFFKVQRLNNKTIVIFQGNVNSNSKKDLDELILISKSLK
jgi:hypothetical protein